MWDIEGKQRNCLGFCLLHLGQMGYEEGLTGKLVTAFEGNWRKSIYGSERNQYQQLNTFSIAVA